MLSSVFTFINDYSDLLHGRNLIDYLEIICLESQFPKSDFSLSHFLFREGSPFWPYHFFFYFMLFSKFNSFFLFQNPKRICYTEMQHHKLLALPKETGG